MSNTLTRLTRAVPVAVIAAAALAVGHPAMAATSTPTSHAVVAEQSSQASEQIALTLSERVTDVSAIADDESYASAAQEHAEQAADASDPETASYHYALAATLAARQSHEMEAAAQDPFWQDQILDPPAAAARYESASYEAARAALTWMRHPNSDSALQNALAKERAANAALSPFRYWY